MPDQQLDDLENAGAKNLAYRYLARSPGRDKNGYAEQAKTSDQNRHPGKNHQKRRLHMFPCVLIGQHTVQALIQERHLRDQRAPETFQIDHRRSGIDSFAIAHAQHPNPTLLAR